MPTAKDHKARLAREARIVKWTRQGLASPGNDSDDTASWEDQVWWAYWRQVGGEDVDPPDALFPSEEEAEAWGVMVGQMHDWSVGPVVLKIEARDNFEIPK